jgi:hypothetical protein
LLLSFGCIKFSFLNVQYESFVEFPYRPETSYAWL